MVKSSLTWVFLTKVKLKRYFMQDTIVTPRPLSSAVTQLHSYSSFTYQWLLRHNTILQSSPRSAGKAPLYAVCFLYYAWFRSFGSALLAASSSPASTFRFSWFKLIFVICLFILIVPCTACSIVPLWGILLSVLWFCIASCFSKNLRISQHGAL